MVGIYTQVAIKCLKKDAADPQVRLVETTADDLYMVDLTLT